MLTNALHMFSHGSWSDTKGVSHFKHDYQSNKNACSYDEQYARIKDFIVDKYNLLCYSNSKC